MSAEDTKVKQRGRPFKKGASGNPKGRPKGSLNKATLALQALLDGQGEALTQKVIEMALAGDGTALRLCIERLIPVRKESPIQAKLPAFEDASDLPQVVACILAEVAQGTLTPGEGQQLTALVESYRKTLETSELERRIETLEAHLKKETKP